MNTPRTTGMDRRRGRSGAAAVLIMLAAVAAGCGRKPLPPTVGEPQDIMKNADGVVGPMPGTPGYKPTAGGK